MKREAAALWDRALESLRAAEVVLAVSPDAAVSRAYYAAFYAVSALLALEGKTFRRHSAVEAAVHGELVRKGRWPSELGASYAGLFELRQIGDYGAFEHVPLKEANEAIGSAKQIVEAVRNELPADFKSPGRGN